MLTQFAQNDVTFLEQRNRCSLELLKTTLITMSSFPKTSLNRTSVADEILLEGFLYFMKCINYIMAVNNLDNIIIFKP